MKDARRSCPTRIFLGKNEMRYESISFEDFKENYIAHADGGYYPVYAWFDEDDESNNLKVVQMDMICQWRLGDGKIRFLEVPFETKEELNEIIAYLKACLQYLHNDISEKIGELEVAGQELMEGE